MVTTTAKLHISNNNEKQNPRHSHPPPIESESLPACNVVVDE